MNETLIHMMVCLLFLKCLQPPSWTCTLRLQQVALVVKNLPANAGDIRHAGLILRSERCLGEGHGNPLQYSSLENPMDRGAWRATVHGIAKRLTRPNRLSMHQALRTTLGESNFYLLLCFLTHIQICWSWSWNSRSHRQDKKLAGCTQGWAWKLMVKMNSQSMWC